MARALVAIAVCSVALASSNLARAESGSGAPAAKPVASARSKMVTYDRNLPWRVGLMVVGGSFLAISYGVPCVKAGGHWCIPYAGPIVAAVKYNRKEADNNNENDGIVPPVFVDTLLVGVSLVQLASTAILVTGALMPRREVTEPLYSLKLGRNVAFTPVAAPSMLGLAASGSF
jgi:hypothetical protein